MENNENEEVKTPEVEELKMEESSTEMKPVEEEKPEEKKKKSKAPILILILLLIVIIAAAVLYVLPKFKNVSVNKTDKTKVSAYRLEGNGLDDFDLYFLQAEKNTKNKIYSPLSIKYALAMLNEGTDGASHEQIESVIGDYKPKKYENNENMSFANAMFIKNTFKDSINKDYTKTLKEKYNAEVIEDDFTTATNINNWVSNKTLKLIDHVVDDADVQPLDFALINALAIDMNWVNALQCAHGSNVPCLKYSVAYQHENYSDFVEELSSDNPNSTEISYPEMTFNNKDKIKHTKIGASINKYDIIKELGEDKIRETVGKEYEEFLAGGGCGDDPDKDTYLNDYIKALKENYNKVDASTDFYFYDDEEVQAFAKDLKEYNGYTLQYVGIMPKEKELTEYVNEINAEKVNNIIKELKDIKAENFEEGVVTKITANIPVFKYEYELQLKEDLKSIGIEDVFDINKADLTKMVKGGKSHYIEKAVHKANIEFSNEGIKASAVTFLGGLGASGCYFDHLYEVPVKEINLTFDKPYLYLIRDKDSGEVWFVGEVVEPAN